MHILVLEAYQRLGDVCLFLLLRCEEVEDMLQSGLGDAIIINAQLVATVLCIVFCVFGFGFVFVFVVVVVVDNSCRVQTKI